MTSYWQRKAMDKRRARLVVDARSGDFYAGRKILATTLAALARAIVGDALDEADRRSLDFLRTGLHDYLIDGVPLERALLIENADGGRPRASDHEILQIYGLLVERVATKRQYGSSAPIREAQNEIAREQGILPRQAREIWQREQAKRLKRNKKK